MSEHLDSRQSKGVKQPPREDDLERSIHKARDNLTWFVIDILKIKKIMEHLPDENSRINGTFGATFVAPEHTSLTVRKEDGSAIHARERHLTTQRGGGPALGHGAPLEVPHLVAKTIDVRVGMNGRHLEERTAFEGTRDAEGFYTTYESRGSIEDYVITLDLTPKSIPNSFS